MSIKKLVAIPQRSIKIKSVVGNPVVHIRKAAQTKSIETDKDGSPLAGQTLVLGFIYGKVTEAFTHTRNIPQPNGEVKTESWPALRGEFECVNAEGTTAHRSTVAFLQDHIIELIANELDRAREQGVENPSLLLAYEIQAQTSDSATAGFVWQLQPKMEMTPQADPLSELRALAKGEDQAALPAPVQAAMDGARAADEAQVQTTVAKAGKGK